MMENVQLMERAITEVVQCDLDVEHISACKASLSGTVNPELTICVIVTPVAWSSITFSTLSARLTKNILKLVASFSGTIPVAVIVSTPSYDTTIVTPDISITQHPLRLLVPTGHMQAGVLTSLERAGIRLFQPADRCYILERDPACHPPPANQPLPPIQAKLMKPRNIVWLLQNDLVDIGFTGADLMQEYNANAVELLDLHLDIVKLVAACSARITDGDLRARTCLKVASEYENTAQAWLSSRGQHGRIIKSYGTTEALVPEIADVVVDTVSTGDTLRANELRICDEIMCSSTRLYASRATLADPRKRQTVGLLVRALQKSIYCCKTQAFS